MTCEQNTRPLLLVSVPYLRVARILLSKRVLNCVADADVVVVTPFADDAAFRAEFARPGIEFLRVPAPRWSRPIGLLYALSESMRMVGFWRRYRRAGLAYYWNGVGVRLGSEGQDVKEGLLRRAVQQCAAILGSAARSWRLLDRAIGMRVFKSVELERVLRRYSRITLVQASSWGYQDRLLAWHARRRAMRAVLIPYTTDQLWVNGDLLCDYDAVCVQGPFEEHCAKRYHGVAADHIVRLGCLWFRSIDDMVGEMGSVRAARSADALRVVLYAGVSPTYFPRSSEFQAIEALLNAARSGRLGAVQLVYRPYALDAQDRAAIEARFAQHPQLQLQWPEEACAALEGYSGAEIAPQLQQYLRRLAAADVMVMSNTTSLAWDAAYLGCAVAANFSDPSGTLLRRGVRLRLQADGLLDCAPGLPLAWSNEELVDLVARLLRDPQAAARSRAAVLSQWDYPDADARSLLRRVVYGSVAHGPLVTSLPAVDARN
jgi:hypothetical protein